MLGNLFFFKTQQKPTGFRGSLPQKMVGWKWFLGIHVAKCTFHMQVKELFIQWNPRADRLKKWSGVMGPYKWPYIWVLLLMEEILHHLGCLKPYKQWDIYHINWCRISSINRSTVTGVITPINGVITLLIFIRAHLLVTAICPGLPCGMYTPPLRVQGAGGMKQELKFHLSNAKKLRCLGYTGDYTTRLCGDYSKPV